MGEEACATGEVGMMGVFASWCQVLAAGDEGLAVENDDVADDVGKLPVARRTVGSLATVSGAAGMYLEYRTGGGGRGRGAPKKQQREKSSIFKQAMRH
jgi:hypothetical protein